MKTPWNDSFATPHEMLARSVLSWVDGTDGYKSAVSHAPSQPRSGSRSRRWLQAARDWFADRKTRKQLHALSDDRLRDIGIERNEIDSLVFTPTATDSVPMQSSNDGVCPVVSIATRSNRAA